MKDFDPKERQKLVEVAMGVAPSLISAGQRLERELISAGVGASCSRHSHQRYVGDRYIYFGQGLRFQVKALGVCWCPAEGTVVERDGALSLEIYLRTSLDAEKREHLTSIGDGQNLAPYVDPLRFAPSLQAAPPEAVEMIVVDPGRGVVRTVPPLGPVALKASRGADGLCVDPDEVFSLFKAICFSSLGLRERAEAATEA